MGASMVHEALGLDDTSTGSWSSRPSERSKTPPAKARVVLHVYSVSQSLGIKAANSALRVLGMGAFHAGVEVYGLEWSYECINGVVCCWPGGAHEHLYLEPLLMGMTSLSYTAVLELIGQFRDGHWTGAEYDSLEHNCCHFSDEFCRHLGVGTLPEWILSLATMGTVARSQARLACKPCCQGCPAITGDGNLNFQPTERQVLPQNSSHSQESSVAGSLGSTSGCTLFGRRVASNS
mmetsp:Transcript_148120/g.369279  ORF Transcript_148120/g.369279 Transcript_148120/m.369279 type:complete len:235 (-) Transcript_148120:37-741(-)